jgi:DNA-directed RNA polymerase specialized sigma24 family protein
MDRRVESDDASLVARTLAGDQSAFGALVSRHESDVFHLALRYLRQREDAEDVSNVCLIAVKKRSAEASWYA